MEAVPSPARHDTSRESFGGEVKLLTCTRRNAPSCAHGDQFPGVRVLCLEITIQLMPS